MTVAPEIRAATRADAARMALLINRIVDIGGTTAFTTQFDADRIMAVFIAPTRALSCFVAYDGDRLAGFQALTWADPNRPGKDHMPADWAVIATYVDPEIHGRGIGSALMAATLQAAADASAAFVDATIRRENTGGLAYYSRMGFEDYRSTDDAVSKRRTPG
ncbi:MAG: GNAT family N-acetyltransferase [Pseudomonadota bacterium]